MAAKILAFPLARRVGFIRRDASWYVEQSPGSAEYNLSQQLRQEREVLLRRGIAPDVAEREVLTLERAIRAEARRLSFQGVPA